MNVTLYVFPKEKLEEIDLAKEWSELAHIESEIQETVKKMEGHLEELKMVG